MQLNLLFAIVVVFYSVQAQRIPSSCGNGILDSGEQCDPSVFGGECCTAQCQFAPSAQACQFGQGVCQKGVCQTRASQCSSYNGALLRFQFPVMPGNITEVKGPFSDCSSGQSQTVSQVIPANYLTSFSCKPKCQGTASNNQPFCIDFTQYRNMPISVADNLACLIDNTGGASQGQIRSEISNGAALQDFFMPGVCVSGACQASENSACRQQRCSGQGECILSSEFQGVVSQSLGISGSSQNISQSLLASAVACKCDSGFNGDFCESVGSQNSSVRDPQAISRSQFNTAIIASVIPTFFVSALICFLLGCCLAPYWKSQSEKRKQAKEQTMFYQPYDEKSVKSGDSAMAAEDGTVKAARQTDSDVRTLHDHDMDEVLRIGENVPATAAKVPGEVQQTDGNIYSSGASNAAMLHMASNTQDSSVPPDTTKSNMTSAAEENKYLRASHSYQARMSDEIDLESADVLYLIREYDDGWAKAYNMRTGKEGVIPLSFVKRISLKPSQANMQSDTLPRESASSPVEADRTSSKDDKSVLEYDAQNAEGDFENVRLDKQ